jgi:8-oxo-dGTP pyrophosphatase MutT (NUDIX family)
MMEKTKSKKSVRTLAIAKKDGKLLLGRKKKKSFGYSKWNGLGGKVEPGESVDQAMIRECVEEGFIEPRDFIKRGIINFFYVNDPDMEVHIYEINEFTGDPNHSEEMEVAWFDEDKIPFSEMWPDDSHWLPLLLEGKHFSGDFYYDENYQIKEHAITEVDELYFT